MAGRSLPLRAAPLKGAALAALTAAACLAAPPGRAVDTGGAPDEPAATDEWHYRVLLDGKPIGTHDFIVRRTDHVVNIETQARLRVTLLSLPVYRYDHHDRETWRDGCLASIDAATDDNGKVTEVRGTQAVSGFSLSRPGSAAWPQCVHTFAYWNPQALAAARLLNSQTGEYAPAMFSGRVREMLQVRMSSGRVLRYELQ